MFNCKVNASCVVAALAFVMSSAWATTNNGSPLISYTCPQASALQVTNNNSNLNLSGYLQGSDGNIQLTYTGCTDNTSSQSSPGCEDFSGAKFNSVFYYSATAASGNGNGGAYVECAYTNNKGGYFSLNTVTTASSQLNTCATDADGIHTQSAFSLYPTSGNPGDAIVYCQPPGLAGKEL